MRTELDDNDAAPLLDEEKTRQFVQARDLDSSETRGLARKSEQTAASLPPLPPNPIAGTKLPSLPGVARSSAEQSSNQAPLAPTIVVNSIVNVPTTPPAQREATLVMKRPTRPETASVKKRSPLAAAVVVALVVVACAIAYASMKRARENAERQELIDQRIEEVRRQHAD